MNVCRMVSAVAIGRWKDGLFSMAPAGGLVCFILLAFGAVQAQAQSLPLGVCPRNRPR
jgi:hypothetical protein